MKKRTIIQNPLFVIAMLIGALLIVLSFQGIFANVLFRVSEPAGLTLRSVGDRMNSFFHPFFSAQELTRENERLQSHVHELILENEALRMSYETDQAINDVLRESVQSESLLSAFPVFFSPQGVLIINRGSNDQVQEGMPVITRERFLVGRVERVYTNFSEVRLPSHPESSFDAKIWGEEIYGVVQGKGGVSVLDFIPSESVVEYGSIILTSRTGGIFPENLFVGQVHTVQREDVASFQHGELILYFHPSRHDPVFIIQDFLSLPRQDGENAL